MKKYNNMSDSEIKTRVNELTQILDGYAKGDWSEAYDEYVKLNAVLDERYRVKNQADFDAYYKEYIEGKALDEIDPQDWSFYSDWHKDMYGFRPQR